ncbi:hypothetical protein VQ045_06310 [Aurantimonas sp. E1-2-R+4]|uniref:hypothetical protein n=1 Tax=Aurantimonas sp. E1-2-R+4 TaxID=3113714 RepID=UPI002F950C49
MGEKIRVIFYQEGDAWMAQGIDRDICVQADELDDLYGRLEVAVRLECEETGTLEHIPAAPDHFVRMWDGRSGQYTPKNRDSSQYEVGMAA